MSGSGGRGFRSRGASEIRTWIVEGTAGTDIVECDQRVNATLGDLLAKYNSRDVELVRSRLEEIQDAIEETLETALDLRFGGSIAKRTFVDGLSDVDALAILRDQEISGTTEEVLASFSETIKRELSYDVGVTVGQLAVTISYDDGMEIQILPAVRTKSGIRIPSASGGKWSSVIRPERFAEKLTERNKDCNNRVVPIIKLAKAALAMLPESIRPSGYHVESLAVEAFKGYSGVADYKTMLHYFFDQGSRLVHSPIRDSTGQSLNVDQDLGEVGSFRRQTLGGAMDRIARRMENADRAGSAEEWLEAIGEDP